MCCTVQQLDVYILMYCILLFCFFLWWNSRSKGRWRAPLPIQVSYWNLGEILILRNSLSQNLFCSPSVESLTSCKEGWFAFHPLGKWVPKEICLFSSRVLLLCLACVCVCRRKGCFFVAVPVPEGTTSHCGQQPSVRLNLERRQHQCFFKSTVFWRTCRTNLRLHWEEKNLGSS